MDITKGNGLTLPVAGDAVSIDTVFLNHEAFNLFSTALRELHVVSVGSSVVAETNNGDLNIGVVFHDAANSFNLDHLVGLNYPYIVGVENRERNSIVVQLIVLQLIEDAVEAVGNALSTSKFFFATLVVLVLELFNLTFKFFLVVFCVSNFFLQSIVFFFESIEGLFGYESALSDELFISSGNTEVVDVTNRCEEVGVVPDRGLVQEERVSDGVKVEDLRIHPQGQGLGWRPVQALQVQAEASEAAGGEVYADKESRRHRGTAQRGGRHALWRLGDGPDCRCR